MKKCLWLCLVLVPLCAAAAQECEGGHRVEASNPPRVQDLAWIAGYWRGTLKDGAAVEQHFAPAEGVVTGIFRLTQTTGEPLYEVIVLRDTERGPELRVRHFLKDFSSLEPGDQPIVMHLSALGTACAEFVNETSKSPQRSVLVRRGNTLQARSYLVRADGTTGTIEVEWQRGGGDVPATASGSSLPRAAWLTGHWRGSFEGGVIEQWWLGPKEGAMAGLMRFLRGTQVSMIEFYGAKSENGKLRTYTWQLAPELLLTDRNPMMTAEAIHASSHRLVFRVLSEKLEATTTVTHRANRMQERVEVKQSGKSLEMVIDFVKSGSPKANPINEGAGNEN